MPAMTEIPTEPRPLAGSLPFASSIEHLLDFCEPTVRAVSRSVWAEVESPTLARVVDLEDLYQEGRIGVFERARDIVAARSPRALAAAVVRSRVYDALRKLMGNRTAHE